MNEELHYDQTDTIRQMFGYLQIYKNAIFVIKTDGRLVSHPLFPVLIRDVVLLHNLGIKIVIVPGARRRIDGILKSFGIETQEQNGVRISSEEAIPFIKMAAFDMANQIMTMFAENNANSVIGDWIRARGMGVINGVDYQYTGFVDKVDSDSILKILDNGMIPIFPNVGWGLSGKAYNISSDDLALKISVALGAEKLFFVTDFGGAAINGSPVSQLTVKETKQILDERKDDDGEETQLLRLAYEAAKSGVKRVHIVGGQSDGTLLKEIFGNIGQGTMVYTDEYDNMRKLTHSDIPEILRITRPLVEKGILIERRREDIEEMIGDFYGFEVDGILHACAALISYDKDWAEVCCVAVDSVYSGMGIGKKIVSFLLAQAKTQGKKRCFLLTTQTSDWFEELGFKESTPENLPKTKREAYNYGRKSQVMVLNLR